VSKRLNLSPDGGKKSFLIDTIVRWQNNWNVNFDWWLFYIYLAGTISAKRRRVRSAFSSHRCGGKNGSPSIHGFSANPPVP
jgi:hypothetical protein